MNLENSLLRLLVLFDVGLILSIKSNFLETVRNSTLLHHKQTNTVWEYLGRYAQAEDTYNFILEIPVFQFMCDVFPVSMASAMQACMQYRTRVLDNGSARRLNELFEAHVGKRDKRQIEEALIFGSAMYGGYKIIGDLFGGNNDEIVHRLDESENFQKHQEKLDDVLITSILSLENNNLILLKSFKSLFDSVNATRSLIHSLLKMSLREQRMFTGWAKFSLKSEMRRHYEQMISAFSRVANHDLNLVMFSPEQRTFLHEFLWNRIRSNMPSDFSATLAQFVPNLLVQQIVSFSQVNESEIVYELKEDDFNFVVETDSDDAVARNETIDLDTILPKIVGHARIEDFFSIPTDFSNKKMDLYKITRLPLFIDEKKAMYTANLPHYLLLGEDGHSAEWLDHANRKCTVDEKSRYMFCSVPVPIFNSIQNSCLRSIILNTSTKDCLKETVDLSSPHIVKFAPNIHAISIYTSLQCFEKGNKEYKNVFSNITSVAIIKTRCNSFVSCGTLDFSSVGGVCDEAESYIFTFNNSYENSFKLDKSVNPVGAEIDNLSPMMDIPSLIESALSHRKHLNDVYTQFQFNIHRTIKTKVWPKIFIGIFILILIVAVCTIVFAPRPVLKKICDIRDCRKKIGYVFNTCFRSRQIDDSPLNMHVHRSGSVRNDTYYNVMHQNKKNAHQSQPLLNKVVCNNLTYALDSNYSIKKTSALDTKVELDYIPLTAHVDSPIPSSDILSSETVCRKPNPVPRKIYHYMRGSFDLSSNHPHNSSGGFFEDDRETDD